MASDEARQWELKGSKESAILSMNGERVGRLTLLGAGPGPALRLSLDWASDTIDARELWRGLSWATGAAMQLARRNQLFPPSLTLPIGDEPTADVWDALAAIRGGRDDT